MANINTFKSLIEKAPTKDLLEVISDVDLVTLHQICKSHNSDNNLMIKNRVHTWTPLVEDEIRFRQDVIKKAKEESDLQKGMDDGDGDDIQSSIDKGKGDKKVEKGAGTKEGEDKKEDLKLKDSDDKGKNDNSNPEDDEEIEKAKKKKEEEDKEAKDKEKK